MIVLDEQLIKPQIIQEFAHWYKGAVLTIVELRPATIVLDDAVTTLLRTVRQPTFVTINYEDFWQIIPASSDYCILCLKLRQSEARLAPRIVRELLRLPSFRTKRNRMGAVISVRAGNLETYRAP